MKYVDPNGKLDFIAPGDEKLQPEEQSVLELVQLTEAEQEFLTNIEETGTRIVTALHLGLAGIRNFPGPDGSMVILRRDEGRRAIVGEKKPWLMEQLVLIPFRIQDLTAGRIMRGVGLSEAVAKNS